jgi:hypothetical protein
MLSVPLLLWLPEGETLQLLLLHMLPVWDLAPVALPQPVLSRLLLGEEEALSLLEADGVRKPLPLTVRVLLLLSVLLAVLLPLGLRLGLSVESGVAVLEVLRHSEAEEVGLARPLAVAQREASKLRVLATVALCECVPLGVADLLPETVKDRLEEALREGAGVRDFAINTQLRVTAEAEAYTESPVWEAVRVHVPPAAVLLRYPEL